jgi:pimeloyl-ACP methyl ester carboxylesterase
MLKNRWLRLPLFSVVVYLCFCAAMACFKEQLIFPVRGVERARALQPPPDAEVWWREIGPGARTEAWFFPGRGRSPAAPGPAVLCFHGNGELIDDNVETARTFNMWGISVLLVEYRGYGRSVAKTEINGIQADAIAWFDRLAARPEVRSHEVMTYGFSLGAAFAAQLAAARPIAALMMESPFASLPSMARRQRVYLYLSSERLDTEAVLRALPAGLPILITHQKRDSIIPVTEGRKLAALRPDALYAEGGDDHYPFALSDLSRTTLRQFLAKFIAPSGYTDAEPATLTQRLH